MNAITKLVATLLFALITISETSGQFRPDTADISLLNNQLDTLSPILLQAHRTVQKILDNQILFVEDSEEKFQLDDLNQLNLSPLEHRNIFEVTEKPFIYWASFKVKNIDQYATTWWLDIPGNFTKVYLKRANGKLENYDGGNLLKQSKKAISTSDRRLSYIPINLAIDETLTIVTKVKTTKFFPINSDFFQIGLPLYFENVQNKKLSANQFLDGLYGAVLMLFCLYCLGYFLFTKARFALWAICYGLTLLFFFYHFNSAWYRLGVSPVFALQAGIVFINLSLFFELLFAKKYLNLKENLPFWNKVYTIAIYYMALVTILQVAYYYFTAQYLRTVRGTFLFHQILYLPHVLLAIALLRSKKVSEQFGKYSLSIYAIGVIAMQVIISYAALVNGNLSEVTYKYIEAGVIVYVVCIVISLSIQAAESQKQKMIAEVTRIKNEVRLEELEELDQVKSRFFANVTHELRTPLTLMIGPISAALKSGQLNNRNFTYLKTAQQNGKDLLKLIGSLLDLSKLEAGKSELHNEVISLFVLIRRIASSFESHAQREDIHFTFNYLAEQNLHLELDREKMEVILNNLLSNAIKFTPKKGVVSVEVKDLGSAIQISVSDTGRGIHPDDIAHVFDRFYQTKQANASAEGGTGIGLALSQEFAKLLGGNISVESTLNEGSSFKVEIPRKEVLGMVGELVSSIPMEVVSVPILTEKVVQHPLTAKKPAQATILVVEDNHSLLNYIQDILHDRYEIVTANNGKAALDLLSEAGNKPFPDLIISDIMMPIMDGFQLLEKLKTTNHYRSIPVILLTARADMEDKLKALRIGVDDYILKPFDNEELLARIENLLINYKNRMAEPIQTEALPEQVKAQYPKQKLTISREDTIWLESFETFVKSHISNSELKVSTLAHEFAMSDSTLLRQLKKLTGLSPNQYIKEVRLNQARQLLENKTYNSIARVASQVGYNDPRSFSRSFKKRFGKLPSEELV